MHLQRLPVKKFTGAWGTLTSLYLTLFILLLLALCGSTMSFLAFCGSPMLSTSTVVFSGQWFFLLSVSARLKQIINNLIHGSLGALGDIISTMCLTGWNFDSCSSPMQSTSNHMVFCA